MAEAFLRPYSFLSLALFVRVGIWLPKNGHKRKFAKKIFNMGRYAKKEERLQKVWGVWEMFEMQKIALRKQEWKELINKKSMNNIKFWKDNISLILLINITKGAIFSWTIKCYKLYPIL